MEEEGKEPRHMLNCYLINWDNVLGFLHLPSEPPLLIGMN